jgi:glycosyltransferase involved in cell wall biosynthesis
MTDARKPIIWFIVESGTDARLVEGLASRLRLEVLARAIPGGRVVSQPTEVPVSVAGSRRLGFAWRVFRTLMRADPYDGVLVQGYSVAALAANLAARLRRKPCWMLVCSPVAEYYETRRAAGLPFSNLTHAAINMLGRMNGVIGRGYVVLSDYLGDVVKQYGTRKPVHVIPVYGVDTRRYATKDRLSARAARGLPATGQIVFSSSRVAPEKDTSTLIHAFAALVAEGRDVYLLHRSGGYEDFLRDAERAGVRQRVIATDAADPRRDLPLDYAAADVCVQASRAEGLGFSVLEALACGTPVIVTAVGGLVETVRDGSTGWTVPPGDAAALTSALRDVLDHPEEARRRTVAGGRIVRERFESDLVFARLASLLSAR